MSTLLDDPMVQAGLAPFAVALLVATLLKRWRSAAWLALLAGLLCTWMLTTGISFTPLSSSRKVMLVVMLAPLLGLVIDLAGWRHRALPIVLSLAAGLLSAWVFQSVLSQAEGAQGWLTGLGVGLFVALMVGLVLRLRDDGLAGGSATLALGVATGVCAVLSASIGTLMNGLALAMGGAALLALQFLRGTPLAGGYTGALSTGVASALFAAGTFMLAELRWPALVLLLAVPAVAGLPLFAGRAPRLRSALLAACAGAAALAPIGMAWFATTGGAAG
ncbi:MAG: hypothetical protein U1F56_05655 [Rubrivivax sp.]